MEGALDHRTETEGMPRRRSSSRVALPAGLRRPTALRPGWIAPSLYAGLALLVAGPVLRPGLVLTVDLAQTPRSTISPAYWGLPTGTNAGSLARLPFDALLRVAGILDGVQVAQKLLLLSIVFLAGLGMHRLVRASNPGRLFAGLLYALNPFVYERLIAGQWFLLLGYALIPWGYRAFLDVWEGSLSAPWRFSALVAIIGFADPHMVVLLAVLCLAAVIARGRHQSRQALLRVGLSLALGTCVSLLWLLPTPGLRELWSHVGHAQLLLYGTFGDPKWGPLLTVLGGGGFWEDPTPAFNALPVWPVFALLLALLSLRGAMLLPDRRLAVAVGICGALGLVAAMGTASGLTRPAEFWLMDHVAALRSFRETDKTVVLVLFAYAFLGGLAIDELVAGARRMRLATPCLALALAIPLVYGGRELWGAWGSLDPVSFPASWQQADQLLARRATDSRTLFLPFHGYLHLSFANSRVTYNPAPSYFSVPILAGRSVDQNPAHQDVNDPEQGEIAGLLSHPMARDVAPCLAALGISHVLLAHEADWRRLAVLEQRPDMSVIRRWPDLTLIALRHPGAFAMTEPAGSRGSCPAGLQPLPARLSSPVRLTLLGPVPQGRRLVLGLPDAFQWHVSGGQVLFTPWPGYRRFYLIAAAGWLAVLVLGLLVYARTRRGSISPRRAAIDGNAAQEDGPTPGPGRSGTRSG